MKPFAGHLGEAARALAGLDLPALAQELGVTSCSLENYFHFGWDEPDPGEGSLNAAEQSRLEEFFYDQHIWSLAVPGLELVCRLAPDDYKAEVFLAQLKVVIVGLAAAIRRSSEGEV